MNEIVEVDRPNLNDGKYVYSNIGALEYVIKQYWPVRFAIRENGNLT